MYRFLFFSFFCLFSLTGKADGVEFDSYTWDFGKILEQDGVVSHTFVVTNNSGSSLLITNAIPSCSCTLVTYPKEAIPHGGKGEIEVKYTPSGAVGKVFRDIQILDYNNREIAMLEITADVKPSDRSIPDRYPYVLGSQLYVNLRNIPMGYVYHGTQKEKIIYLANSSDKPQHVEFQNDDPRLSLQYPDTLQPGEEAEMSIIFHAPSNPDYFAQINDSLHVRINGERALLPVVVSMIALPKVEATDHSANMRTYPSDPRLRKKGKAFVSHLEIYNDGEDDLLINEIQVPPTVTTSLLKGERIPKGKKRILELKNGVEEEFLLQLFTNDPVRPMKEVRIKKALAK